MRNISWKHGLMCLAAGLLVAMPFLEPAYAHGMSEADKLAIVDGGNLIYLWIGATHMLSGYDHLAFVFGIIFFLSTFRDIVKYVSAFTIGHSITLIYATFAAIQFNYFLVDAVIALSVCYIAFANLDGFRKYLNINPPNMLMMIVGLGLIHGFGLSSRLQDLPLSADHLLLNIISFNVGIELGQVTALALMLLLVASWRKRSSFKAFSLIANYVLILAGAFLFLMQMHDYSHANDSRGTTVVDQPSTAIDPQDYADYHEDHITVDIPARGEIEYKVLLSKDAVLNYTWESNNVALFFDFHGDPKGDTTGYFKSYQQGTESKASGSLTAPFEGKHGWYWKNNSQSPARVSLVIKGDYQLREKHRAEDSSMDMQQTQMPLEQNAPQSDFLDLEPSFK
ncbi:MAG: HupE/UreJ family protein [Ghiorsea sp.]